MAGGEIMLKLYTCEEIAEIFSVKIITVYDWIKKGKLKACKIEKSYRITQEQLDAFIRERT